MRKLPPPSSHVIQLTGTIFKLNSRIKETNVLSKFHENWAKNVTSIVFTCFHYIHIEKNAPPTGGHVFSPISTIFQLIRDINKTNVLTNFHGDWAKIVTSRVFTRENCHYIHIEKNAPPTGHVFSIHQLNQSKIVTSRVFTRKTAPPTGGHLLTKFHEDGTRNVASTVFTSKCLQLDIQRTKTGHKSAPEQSEPDLSTGFPNDDDDIDNTNDNIEFEKENENKLQCYWLARPFDSDSKDSKDKSKNKSFSGWKPKKKDHKRNSSLQDDRIPTTVVQIQVDPPSPFHRVPNDLLRSSSSNPNLHSDDRHCPSPVSAPIKNTSVKRQASVEDMKLKETFVANAEQGRVWGFVRKQGRVWGFVIKTVDLNNITTLLSNRPLLRYDLGAPLSLLMGPIKPGPVFTNEA
ncbi:hypothetical protein DPMN_182616 [Dreissena polymorpha]|uniref:Uncharacterized protein n=1 Tax=Dreissena polymorpha TaxID=45954 RepID=A0A9D4I5K4_DREPO|nr:hypothetical protein DPMN_182616 [Dreissena polymorpha]